MSDNIFHEVDEEVRREQLKQLWNRYGNFLIAAAVVVVLGIAAWRGYQWWEARKSAQAGAAFEAAVELADQSKNAEAQAAFAKIAADAPANYRILARFREAAALGKTDAKAAVKAYDDLAGDSSLGGEWQDLARLRAGLLLVDSGTYEEVRQRLEPLASAGRTFRHTAREVLAVAAFHAGDSAATKHWIDLIITDAETPASTRDRVEMLRALTRADAKS